MTVAQELRDAGYYSDDGTGCDIVCDFDAAIDAALERAAQEAENIGRLAVAGETGREAARFAAERIRRLKSPAGPVQPSQEQDEHA